MVGEEPVKLYALLEILNSLEASDVLEEIEVSVNVDAGSDESMPVDTLQLDVGVVLLELEVDGVTKVNVWSLDCMHVFSAHFELVEVEVFWEHFHFVLKKSKSIKKSINYWVLFNMGEMNKKIKKIFFS